MSHNEVPPEEGRSELLAEPTEAGRLVYDVAKALGWPVENSENRFAMDGRHPYMLIHTENGFVELLQNGLAEMFSVVSYFSVKGGGRLYDVTKLPLDIKVPNLAYNDFLLLVVEYRLDVPRPRLPHVAEPQS